MPPVAVSRTNPGRTIATRTALIAQAKKIVRLTRSAETITPTRVSPLSPFRTPGYVPGYSARSGRRHAADARSSVRRPPEVSRFETQSDLLAGA